MARRAVILLYHADREEESLQGFMMKNLIVRIFSVLEQHDKTALFGELGFYWQAN